MPYLGEMYTVSGLIMALFLASRAASGSYATEGPSPSVGEFVEPLGDAYEGSDDVVAW